MPGRNQMGPMGQGPMTGRGMGRCGGANTEGNALQGGRGRGMGRGRGRGAQGGASGGGRHGWRHGFNAAGMPLSKEQEHAALTEQARNMEQALVELKSRIKELEKPTQDTTASTQKE